MEGKLLLAVSCRRVPDDCCPVHSRREDVVAGLVPLESKYRSLVLSQGLLLLAVGVPDPDIISQSSH